MIPTENCTDFPFIGDFLDKFHAIRKNRPGGFHRTLSTVSRKLAASVCTKSTGGWSLPTNQPTSPLLPPWPSTQSLQWPSTHGKVQSWVAVRKCFHTSKHSQDCRDCKFSILTSIFSTSYLIVNSELA